MEEKKEEIIRGKEDNSAAKRGEEPERSVGRGRKPCSSCLAGSLECEKRWPSQTHPGSRKRQCSYGSGAYLNQEPQEDHNEPA